MKYKVTLYCSTDHSRDYKVVGTYKTKEEASKCGYNFVRNGGYTSSCDTEEDVYNALMTRDFYMLAYGPRELEVAEIEK